MNDEPIFDALRRIKGKPLTQFDVDDMKRAITASMSSTIDPLTVRVLMETVEHEAVVQEAYLDSERVWTWAIGLTAKSGVDPLKYKDKPASMSECLTAFVNRVRAVYLPEVLQAFAGHALSETQLGAALAFHYNTGAILRTEWVKLWRNGHHLAARTFLESHYLNGGDLTERRKAEGRLFFDGVWSQSGLAKVYPVAKPSYQPAWSKMKRVDVRPELAKVLAG